MAVTGLFLIAFLIVHVSLKIGPFLAPERLSLWA
jgi:hypothetical protein